MKIRNKTPLHRLPVFRILLAQLAMSTMVALAFTCFSGLHAGRSALIGGMIALTGNLYFASKAFRYAGARSTRAIVLSFWSGEAGKQILTAALFVATFVGVRPLFPVALFTGYLLVLAIGASALLLLKQHSKH